MNLIDYGWDAHFEDAYQKIKGDDTYPARITIDYGQSVSVASEIGVLDIDRAIHDERMLAVGDFVVLKHDKHSDRYTIYDVLERKTKFSRAAAGPVLKEQIVAANIDTVFIMQSLNNDFNVRRLERYLIATWESGAQPVIILSKSDLCDDIERMMDDVFAVAVGVEVHSISAINDIGIDAIRKYFAPGKTVALLGSSGVGKSTLVNTLAGQHLLKTQEVLRTDHRGRHTTTHRELVLLPGGGVILDTPGMRSLALWEASEGLDTMFSDIESLAETCRFADCVHESEPNCAVKDALNAGTLTESRWLSYKKLLKEIAHIERKKNQKERIQEKQFAKMVKGNSKTVW